MIRAVVIWVVVAALAGLGLGRLIARAERLEAERPGEEHDLISH